MRYFKYEHGNNIYRYKSPLDPLLEYKIVAHKTSWRQSTYDLEFYKDAAGRPSLGRFNEITEQEVFLLLL